MKRRVGVSVLAVFLILLALAGFGKTYVTLIDPEFETPILGVLALVHGVAALGASLGLWRQRRWAYPAFLSWTVVVLLMSVTMQFSVFHVSWLDWSVFMLSAGGVLWALALYVRGVSE